MTTDNNWNLPPEFLEFIREKGEPRISFHGALRGLGDRSRARPIANFFQGRFNEIFDQYLGSLGEQLNRNPNRLPTQSFTEFLQGDTGNMSKPGQGFNFQRQFFNTAPTQRGSFDSRFAPGNRVLPF